MAAYVQVSQYFYIGAATDTKPASGVPVGTKCYEHDTKKWYITYNAGANWVEMQDLDAIVLGASTALIGKVGIDQTTPGTTNRVDVGTDPVFGTIACGELAGNAAATQMPAQACRLVKFKAAWSNAGKVYIGGAAVTKVDGTTDVTTGIELAAGEETGWLPVSNLNVFYRICDNAGDDLTYLAMVS